MTGITFYLRALQGHEASMVAPFFQCSPLFGYILAYFVLGETLSPRQLLGGALIIGGVLSVSIGSGKMRGRFRWQLAALMLCAGFVLSLSTLDLQGVRHQGRVLGDRVLDVRRRGAVRRGLSLHPAAIAASSSSCAGRTARRCSASMPRNELINLGGGLANRYALIFAPLAIVQALGSTTSLFVFLIGVVLSLAAPSISRESLSLRECVQKGLAAVLVAIGVALVSR